MFVAALKREPRAAVGFVIGPVVVVLFGGALVCCLLVLARRGPTGLRVDATGFEDTSSLNTARHVPWSDVTGWSVVDVVERTLCVTVSDPEAVIARMPSRFARRAARANRRVVGTPVTIAVANLKAGRKRSWTRSRGPAERGADSAGTPAGPTYVYKNGTALDRSESHD